MSAERFTLDTNILIYAIDRRNPAKNAIAQSVVRASAQRDCLLTNQSLSEFFAASTRKMRMPAADAATQIRDWMTLFPGIETTRRAIDVALTEAQAGRFAYWDALLLATAEQAGCTLAFSEDMTDGASLGGLVVRSPFHGNDPSDAAQTMLGL